MNPFNEENPFDDPSIAIAIQNGPNSPFEEEEQHMINASNTNFQSSFSTSHHTIVNSSTNIDNNDEEKTTKMYSSENNIGVLDPREQAFLKREEELKRKERELEERRAEIEREKENIVNPKENNWPPFYPFMYHDIEKEIPTNQQSLVKKMYHYWLGESFNCSFDWCQ